MSETTKIEGAIPKGVWFVIASRCSTKNGAGWRLHEDAIISIDAAREAHDAGMLDMLQSRKGDMFYQNVRFRVVPDKERRPWFFRPESDHDKKQKKAAIRYPGERRSRRRTVDLQTQI